MTSDPNTPDRPPAPSSSWMEPPQVSSPEGRPSFDLRDRFPSWTGWDVLMLAFVALISIIILSFVGIAVARVIPAMRGMPLMQIAQDARIIVPVQVAAYVVVFALMVLFARRGRGISFWRAVHWNFPQRNWSFFLVGGLALALLIQFSSALLPIPKQLPIEQFFKSATSAYIMAVFGITIAPLMEELFFRGFLYPVLQRRIGIVAAVLITAFLFALLHQSQLAHAWGPLLLLFVVGIVLTAVRARTESVGSSFLIHMAYNTTLFVLLWFGTDHFHNLKKAMSVFIFR